MLALYGATRVCLFPVSPFFRIQIFHRFPCASLRSLTLPFVLSYADCDQWTVRRCLTSAPIIVASITGGTTGTVKHLSLIYEVWGDVYNPHFRLFRKPVPSTSSPVSVRVINVTVRGSL